jgi:hypothetical protein
LIVVMAMALVLNSNMALFSLRLHLVRLHLHLLLRPFLLCSHRLFDLSLKRFQHINFNFIFGSSVVVVIIYHVGVRAAIARAFTQIIFMHSFARVFTVDAEEGHTHAHV